MTTLTRLNAEERLLDRQAASSIRHSIITGELPPQHRLLETGLSRELDVSRGTVRSALMQLANEGLVQQVAFTKWQVSGASAQEAWELYTMRAVLEGLAARLAATYASETQKKAILKVYGKLEKALRKQDRGLSTELDFELHRLIVECSGHERLIQDHARLIIKLRFQMNHIGSPPSVADDLIAVHQQLIDAVLAGDGATAETLARRHNQADIDRLEDSWTASRSGR